jgi:NADP-dependent aldehyde dehydrogenase
MDVAAAREVPIPVYTEMGSINPVFICEDALKTRTEAIAAGLSASVCLGTGQFCTSPGVVITLRHAGFEKVLKEQFEAKGRGVLLHARIADAFSASIERMTKRPDVTWVNPVPPSDDPLVPPNVLLKTSAVAFLADHTLSEEIFGPTTLLVVCDNAKQMAEIAGKLSGNLTASLHATDADAEAPVLLGILEQKVGRVVFNGFPTGVEVVPSQQHGGPYPAASVGSSTSVGADAITRFARFVAYQATPDDLLPAALKDANPWGIHRKVNGKLTRDPIL